MNPAVAPLWSIREAALPATISLEEGTDADWKNVILKHPSGEEIAIVERNPIVLRELGSDELLEFIDEVGQYEPARAAKWLQNYLANVRVIYAFQVLQGASIDNGWEALRSVHTKIWNFAGGIIQADGEGFSNESGYTILWQFADDVTGTWNVGLLDDDGKWKHFEMDLGNPQHREAFQRGVLPSGVKML